MRQHFLIILIVLVLIILIGGFIVIKNRAKQAADMPTTASQPPKSTPAPAASTSQPTAQPTPTPEPAKKILTYPIDRFSERLTKRFFGGYYTSADAKNLACGGDFTGYHTGDDLETFADEADSDVPVYAIADGTVREVKHVNGYGGLVVIQHELNGQVVTAYYGHISLTNTLVKAGDSVTAGQKITILGKGCSSETDGERKHLHFDIHKGTSIVYNGYVKTQKELDNWIDPKTFFSENHATGPTN